MGIEGPMMLDNNGDIFDKFMELPNGCLCCSAKDDLYKALEFFQDKNSKYKLDFIVIETNGLGDPSNTIKSLWADDALEFPAKIKSINSIISLDNWEKLYDDDLFKKQIIFSDRIFLNKIDLFDQLCQKNVNGKDIKDNLSNKKARMIENIKVQNPLATIVQ